MATVYLEEEPKHRTPDYDLESAWINTPQEWTLENVKDVLATVAGANDELNWYWVIELAEPVRGARFVLADGWCDHTGWDCKSGLTTYYSDTAEGAATQAPEVEEFGHRCIRQCLLDQLSGKEPYGVYTERP